MARNRQRHLLIPPFPSAGESFEPSDSELIDAVIASSGVGDRLLQGNEAWTIARLSPAMLAERAGIDIEAASRVHAAFMLAHRIRDRRARPRRFAGTIDAILEVLRDHALMAEQEAAFVLCLDGMHELLASRLLAIGTMDRVALDVGMVLRWVLELGGAALILVHNHVLGSLVRPVPSTQDITFTRALRDAALTVELEFLDHLLIGRNGAVSSVLRCLTSIERIQQERQIQDAKTRQTQVNGNGHQKKRHGSGTSIE